MKAPQNLELGGKEEQKGETVLAALSTPEKKAPVPKIRLDKLLTSGSKSSIPVKNKSSVSLAKEKLLKSSVSSDNEDLEFPDKKN